MIIEGTLRNPSTPINTCKELLRKGYTPELVVITCSAEAEIICIRYGLPIRKEIPEYDKDMSEEAKAYISSLWKKENGTE